MLATEYSGIIPKKKIIFKDLKELQEIPDPGIVLYPEYDDSGFITNSSLSDYATFRDLQAREARSTAAAMLGLADDGPRLNYRCEICVDKSYMSDSGLGNHMKKEHQDAIQCHICGKTLANPHNVKLHIKVDHEQSEVINDDDDVNNF